jgi:hypothetical protein
VKRKERKERKGRNSKNDKNDKRKLEGEGRREERMRAANTKT